MVEGSSVRSRPLPGRLISCVVAASGSSISNSISGSISGCRCTSCSSRASNSAWFFLLNRSTRPLTIIVPSGLFLCHLYNSRCTFASHISWPRLDIFGRVLVFTAVRGSRSSYTSSYTIRQYLCRSEEIVLFSWCQRLAQLTCSERRGNDMVYIVESCQEKRGSKQVRAKRKQLG